MCRLFSLSRAPEKYFLYMSYLRKDLVLLSAFIIFSEKVLCIFSRQRPRLLANAPCQESVTPCDQPPRPQHYNEFVVMTVLCLFVVPSTCLVYLNWKSPTLPRMTVNNSPVSGRDLATFNSEVTCRWRAQP